MGTPVHAVFGVGSRFCAGLKRNLRGKPRAP